MADNGLLLLSIILLGKAPYKHGLMPLYKDHFTEYNIVWQGVWSRAGLLPVCVIIFKAFWLCETLNFNLGTVTCEALATYHQ